MLVSTKREVDEVAALLVEGAASPTDLAKLVIKKVTELREERKVHALVFGLGNKTHVGFGPFATVDAAFNSVDKNPMAYIATRAAIVPILGPHKAQEMLAAADEPPSQRGDWLEVELDKRAFKAGWKGSMRDRARFLPEGS